MDRLPEFAGIIITDAREIDDRSVAARPISDGLRAVRTGEVDRETQAAADRRGTGNIVLVVYQTELLVEFAEVFVGLGGHAAREAQLVQAVALTDGYAEGAGDNFGEELSSITGRDSVEFAAVIGEQAGEDVETPGCTFRICLARDVGRQAEFFCQRDNVDLSALERGGLGERDLFEGVGVELAANGGVFVRKKAGAHAISDAAEPQVNAGGLNLVGRDGTGRVDLSARNQISQALRRKDSGRVLSFGEEVEIGEESLRAPIQRGMIARWWSCYDGLGRLLDSIFKRRD